MHRPRFPAVVCLGLVLSSAPISAHHSFSAEFDAKDHIILKGAVQQVDWANPHASIRLTVRGPDGTSANWEVEFGPPAVLSSRGVRKDDFRIGAQVTVDGYRGKKKALTVVARILTLPDGTELFVR